jgi:hypothetical protein
VSQQPDHPVAGVAGFAKVEFRIQIDQVHGQRFATTKVVGVRQ